MKAFDTIHRHRSIRAYRPDPIPDEVLDRILSAATRASTSGNMQTYSIIVTKDAERRRELWGLHFKQDMILQAPLLLTFCADWHRMIRWCRLSNADPAYGNLLSFLVAFADALIAAQNAALAAEESGLGICYMGTTICNPEKLTAFFELPEHVVPATTLVVGYPDEDPELRARLPMSGVVHEERYARPSDEELLATYRSRETEGWDRYMAIPELAKTIEESGVKNLAQIYTRLKYVRENNVAISRELLEVLEAQGFTADDADWPPAPH